MKLRFVQSATVEIEAGGCRVLCDPWLTDGAFYGSWCHFPPLQFQPEDFAGVDHLYLSHIHPDHADPATLERLPRHLPVLIHRYQDPFFRRNLEKLGFANVIELEHGEKRELAPDFSIQSFAADNCDPTVCGRQFGCALAGSAPYRTMQIDSVAVFQAGDEVLVNLNDCPLPLGRAVAHTIAGLYPRIDLACIPYSGAGPYPHFFANLSPQERHRQGLVKREKLLQHALDFLEILQPRAFMPFAGEFVYSGRLIEQNQSRGIPFPEELPAEFARLLAGRGLSNPMVLLNSGETYDLTTGQASAPFRPADPHERQRYLREVLASRKFFYEESPAPELGDLLERAFQRFQAALARHNYSSNWRVYLDSGQDELDCVPYSGEALSRAARGEEREPYVTIKLEPSLLAHLLGRRAHWNNAENGGHLQYFRQPDDYEYGVYHFLSYLHA